MVLIGALLIFGERLNALQWIGVGLAVFSLFMLSRAGRREGIDFGHNVWIVCVAAAALLGAASGLYDRYLMQRLEPIFVQGWYNLYQTIIMIVVMILMRLFDSRSAARFHWSWAIPMISILLTAADMAYFVALSDTDAMISVVSMIRRGSVVVSFACGALLFPRAQPQGQGTRSGTHNHRYGLPLLRQPLTPRDIGQRVCSHRHFTDNQNHFRQSANGIICVFL